jgi:hypothetical protein
LAKAVEVFEETAAAGVAGLAATLVTAFTAGLAAFAAGLVATTFCACFATGAESAFSATLLERNRF